MTDSKETEANARPLANDVTELMHVWFGGRRGLLAGAALMLTGVLSLNWNWLVAVGIAPLMAAVLPCLVMCGLGVCMNRLMGSSCESAPASDTPDPASETVTRLDATPSTGSVPVVRRPAVRRRRKKPAKKPRKRTNTAAS